MKTITPTMEDIILSLKLNLYKNPNHRIFRAILSWRWFLIILGIACSSIGLYLKLENNFYNIANLTFYTSLIFWIVGFKIFIMPFIIRKLAKQKWKKNKILHEPYTLTWSSDYLFIESNKSKSQIEWRTYCEMIHNENYVLAYYQQNMFLIIPKRFFENNEETQTFLNYLQAGIAQNKANLHNQ